MIKHLLNIDDLQIQVKEYGDKCPSLILIHGWNTLLDQYEEFLNKLSASFHLYTIALPGYGKSSDTAKATSFHFLGQIVHRVIQKLNIKNFTFLGHSMGTQVVLHYVRDYKFKGKLILIETPSLHLYQYIPFWAKIALKNELLIKFIRVFPFLKQQAVNYFLNASRHLSLNHQKNKRRFEPVFCTMEGAYNSLIALGRDFVNPFSFPNEKIFIYGEHDVFLKQALQEKADLLVLKNSGHSFPELIANGLLEAINNFLKEERSC